MMTISGYFTDSDCVSLPLKHTFGGEKKVSPHSTQQALSCCSSQEESA